MMGVSISRLRSTGLLGLTTDVGGLFLCTAGEGMGTLESWHSRFYAFVAWEGDAVGYFFFRTRGPVGWLLESVFFFFRSFASMGDGINAVFEGGGTVDGWALLSLVLGGLWSF